MSGLGYTKDWTTEFFDCRSSYSGSTLVETNMQIIDTHQQTQWSGTVDDIKNRIQNVSYKLLDLEGLQRRYLQIDLDDYDNLGKQIDNKTNEIKRDLKLLQNDVIRFARFKEIDNPTVIQNVQSALVEDLQKVSENFKTQNKNYLLKLKQRTSKFADCFTDENEFDGGYTFGFDDDQLNMLEESTDLVNQRVAEIKKITQTVAELAEMTSQLNMLVHEQGTIIDRIDYNVEHTEKQVEKAVEEIQIAERYQKASIVKVVVLVLAGLIIGALIIFIIKLSV